jgi:superfamily I DNA/RNA helicase
MMLTEQQQAVVDWCLSGTGHAVVEARAGTGKTFVVKQCLSELNRQGTSDMAVLAYNKSIADEIKADIKRPVEDGGLGITDWKVAMAGTVHSFAFSAWRKVANQDLVVEANKTFDIIERIIANQSMSNDLDMVPGYIFNDLSSSIAKAVSLAKNHCIGIKTGIDDLTKWYELIDHYCIHESEEHSVEDLVSCSIHVLRRSIGLNREVIDFDDMIYAPIFHRAKIWPKSFVFVDEAQDLSPLRTLFANILAGTRGRLVFVGDSRQSIYGFSGADTDALDKIKADLGAEVLPLTVTWRCGKAIVEKAKRLVPDYEAAESNQEGTVTSGWLDNLGPGDAVISRKNADLVSLAYKRFLAKGIGCKVEGRDIGKNLKRLATRWKRVKTIAGLHTQLDSYLDRETTKWLSKDKPEMIETIQDQVDTLKIIMGRCQDKKRLDVEDVVQEIGRMFEDNVGEKGEVLTLTTAHKSKGREWDRVVLFKASEIMNCPWDRRDWQVQQSANLMYVAITRARNVLSYVNVEEAA